MAKAFIFDFDGVIVLSEGPRFKILQTICLLQGLSLPDITIHDMVGKTTNTFLKIVFPNIAEETLSKIQSDYKKEYKERIVEHIQPVAFVVEMIASYLGAQPIAVASGSDTELIKKVLTHFTILEKFSLVLGKESVTQLKPNPEIYLKVAELLQISQKDCLVFEDTAVGVEAGIAAGMSVYGILNGFNNLTDFASLTISGLIENKEQLQTILTDG